MSIGEIIGDILILCYIPLAMICASKFSRWYCRAIDEILQDISNAVNGKYKSKYKK